MGVSKTTSNGKRFGYVRVSSADQNDARQLDGVVPDKIFTDKASGKDTNRPQLKSMQKFVREGDVIFVHSIDRLSRSLSDLQSVVEDLTGKGITLSFVKESLTFEPTSIGADAHKTAYSTLMLQLLGAVGQFERALIKERQREGIAIAKANNLYKGRKPKLDKAGVENLQRMVVAGVKKVDIAEQFGISRASVYAYLNI